MIKKVFTLGLIILLCSCASYKTKIKEGIGTQQKPEAGIVHTVYLIGDAGYAKMDEIPIAVKKMKAAFSSSDVNASIFFLGDNVYEDGIAAPGHEEEALSVHRLQVQIDLAKSFHGKSYFIPGNHDWGFGFDAIKRQQNLVESQLGDEAFLPDNGCSGPVLINLNDDLVAIVFDSEWYLDEWSLDVKNNQHCQHKTRQELVNQIDLILSENKEKNVIVVMHHPLFSYGPHGGFYSTKDHLFPLTSLHPALYLPLPIIGSLVALVRRNVQRPQDLGHERYNGLREALLKSTEDHQRIIFVSGHEHTQQWIKEANRHFIVTGAGSKTDPARLGKKATFASGKPGFCALDFYDNNEVWIRFYSAEKKDAPVQLVLQAPVYTVTD